ncbi:MAG: hypothetical protein JXR58_13965 [Bacteroidales bacterium]|nr:hypothetical protein [Bacteroidales bacterium]
MSTRILITTVIAALFISTGIQAQGKYGNDSVECVKRLSLYDGFLQQENYKDALTHWRWVFNNCPEVSKRIYIDGNKIVNKIMETIEDEAVKDKYVDTLMMIYDKRMKYFEEECKVWGLKSVDYFNFRRKVELEKSYEYLVKAFDLCQNETHPAVLVKYMQATVLMHMKKIIDDKQFVDNFSRTFETIGYFMENNPDDPNGNKTKEIVLSLLMNSDIGKDNVKLISTFETLWTDKNGELYVARAIISVISAKADKEKREERPEEAKKLTDSKVFFNALEKLVKEDPSESTYAILARLSEEKGKYSDAVEYYKKALELSVVDKNKGNYNFEIAKISGSYLNSYGSARNYAYLAKDLNPDLAPNVYILVGTFYGKSAGSCGDSKLGNKDVYWIAYDMVAKALNYELSDGMRNQVNKLMTSFKGAWPTQQEIFFATKNPGDSHKVECWINETTTVRPNEN